MGAKDSRNSHRVELSNDNLMLAGLCSMRDLFLPDAQMWVGVRMPPALQRSQFGRLGITQRASSWSRRLPYAGTLYIERNVRRCKHSTNTRYDSSRPADRFNPDPSITALGPALSRQSNARHPASILPVYRIFITQSCPNSPYHPGDGHWNGELCLQARRPGHQHCCMERGKSWG